MGKRTILLVEDDAGVRRAARIALQREGYLVIEVSDPLAVATIARESTHAIDLLLTDVVMPALSGREVCEQVRAIIPNLPVLYMSGYPGDVRTREHSLDPDAPFLPKPFTAESLAEAVGLALDGAP